MSLSHRIATALVALTAASTSVAAQATHDTTKQLPSIVVTATRVPVAAVTAATTVLDGAALRARSITHVLDALREVPGAFIVQTGSFGGQTSLFLRGSESSYTRVLVDGVPVNDPGGTFDFANLTTENVDRIEIVRGPASVLYGTDAVAGVVQIFTNRGGGPLHVSASASGGTLATMALDATLQGGTDAATYSLGISQFQSDGIYAFNNSARHTVLSSHVMVAADSATTLRLSLQYADDRTSVPTDGAGNPVDHNASQFGQRLTLGMDVDHRVTQWASLHLLLGASDNDGGFNDAQDDAADTLGFYAFQSLDHIQRRSADARVDLTVADGIVASGGGVLEEEKERSFNESLSQFGPSDGSFDGSRWNRAAYAQVVGTRGGVAWNVSGRVDRNEAFGTFGTWRVGAAYQLPAGARVRSALGTAFREPTFFENYATGFVRGNPGLSPEHTRSWEIGWDQRLTDGARLSATWFNQHFQDMIDFTFTSPSPTAPNYFNIAAADANGVELSGTADLPGRLTIGGTYTHFNTSVAAAGYDSSATGLFAPGTKLVRRPDYVWSASAGMPVGERARVDVRVLGTGSREDIDFNAGARVVLAPYTLVDISGEADVLRDESGHRVGLTARIANALDEQYQAIHGFKSPGRTILAGLRATW